LRQVGSSVAEGVHRHPCIAVEFGHLSVGRKAEERHDGHLFCSVHPSQEQAEADGAHKEARWAQGRGEHHGEDEQGDADEEPDQTDAQPGGDVFTPRSEEHALAGFQGITESFAFEDEVGEHEEGHHPPSETAHEVNHHRKGLVCAVVAAARSPFKRLEDQPDGSCDDAPQNDDREFLDGGVEAVGEMRVASGEAYVGVGHDGAIPEHDHDAQHHVRHEREAEVGRRKRPVGVDRPRHFQELGQGHADQTSEAHQAGENHVNEQLRVLFHDTHAQLAHFPAASDGCKEPHAKESPFRRYNSLSP